MTFRVGIESQRARNALRWIAVIASIGAACLPAGCGDKSGDKPADTTHSTGDAKVAVTNSTDPQWVVQGNPHRDVAVVFVHGIFGDTLRTWSPGAGKPAFWDLMVSIPDVGPKLDMYAFGFTSQKLAAGSLDIREAANTLHESLRFQKVLDYPTIVFVAHSMGGLVVLRELINHRDLIEKVPLVVLYATPQEGSQIAEIASKVANNPALAEMFGADRNQFLQMLDEDWKRLPVRPHVTCGYEKRPTYNAVVIVPWSSATRYCDDAAVPIEGADHISIVKPDRPNHGSIMLLTNRLNEFVLGANLAAKLETPDFLPEGDHVVFKVSDPFGKSSANLLNRGKRKLTFSLAQISNPNLYLWPDAKREIPGEGKDQILVGFGFGATSNEYQFVLESDASPPQKVVVRIADLAAFRNKQQAVAENIQRDVKNAPQLSVPGGDAKEALATVVADTLARQNPELPKYAQWVMAANFLSVANLSDAAKIALRRAETLSPATAKSSSVQWLGGVVAAQAGEPAVFATTPTRVLTKAELATANNSQRYADIAPSANRLEFARSLKDKPALNVEGWKLEGDVHASNGDNVAAKNAYMKAAESQKGEMRFDRTPKSELELRAFPKEVPKASAVPEITKSEPLIVKNRAVGVTKGP